jgi:hypothetical protein
VSNPLNPLNPLKAMFSRRRRGLSMRRRGLAEDLHRIANSMEIVERWAILQAAQLGVDLTAPAPPAPDKKPKAKDEPEVTYTDQTVMAERQFARTLLGDLVSSTAAMNPEEKDFFHGDRDA